MNSKTYEIPVTRRKIIEFGVTFFVILAVIVPLYSGWRNGWQWQPWLLWPVGIGTVLALICATTGMMMAPAYRAWMRLALFLGNIMTAVIVTLVFYLIITPIGLLRRLFRSKSSYEKGFDRESETYWVERCGCVKPEDLEKMY